MLAYWCFDMTDFEKALEAAAIFYWQDKIAKFFPTSTGPTDLEKDMFRQGAIWSRKFTIDEVCEYLKNIGCVCNRAWNEHCVCEDYESVVIAIEQHFKGRGTK